MLNRLILENFKKHESLDVTFTEGLNVVFGDNYKGKTTLFYGFLYAIGGPTFVPGGSALLDRRDEDGGKHKHRVVAEFTVAGKQYQIERSASKCNLRRQAEEGEPAGMHLVANSAKNVADELAAILGFPVRRLAQLKYAEQGNMKALLTIGAGELNKIVEEVAEVEVVNVALKGCSDIVKVANAKLEVLRPPSDEEISALACEQAQLEEIIEEQAAATDSLAKELATAGQAVEAARAATDVARQQAEKAMAANRAAEQHNQQIKLAEQNLQLKQERLETIAGELAPLVAEEKKLGSAVDVQDKLAATSAERERMAAEVQAAGMAAERRRLAEKAAAAALTTSGQALEALQAGNNHALKELGAEAEGGETVTELANELLQEVADQLAELVSGVAEAADARAVQGALVVSLTKAVDGAECPSCHRAFDDHDPEKLEQERQAAIADLKKCETVVNELRAREARLQGLQAMLTEALRKCREAEAASARASQDLANCPVPSSETAALAEKIRICDQRISQLTVSLEQIRSVSERVAKLRNEHAALVSVVEQLSDNLRASQPMELQEVPSLAAFIDSQRAAEDRREEVRLRYSAMAESLRQMQRNASDKMVAIETLRTKKAEALEFVDRRSDATELQRYLKDNRDNFLTEVWDGIMGQASRFASSCTSGDIRSISRMDEDFYFDEGLAEAMPVTVASGAQKTFMGIGVQTALATMMNTGFNTLMLDEPAADLREERSVALMAALKATGQQVIVISHSMTDAALADNTIEIA